MPDILEINQEIRSRIMGARATIDVYEWLGGYGPDNINFIDCPRVTVAFERDEQFFQASIHFSPEVWPDVTPEFIGDWFISEFEEIL